VTDSYGGWVNSLAVNAKGTVLAAATQGGVTLFDISDGKLSCIPLSSPHSLPHHSSLPSTPSLSILLLFIFSSTPYHPYLIFFMTYFLFTQKLQNSRTMNAVYFHPETDNIKVVEKRDERECASEC
jgi:hypothetical protein